MRGLLVGAVALMAAGCAAFPDQIDASLVSPDLYAGMSCEQIRTEYQRVGGYLEEVSADQGERAGHDAHMTAIGFMAWPAWFGVGGSGPDKSGDVAMYKGERVALYTAGSKANCWIEPSS